MKMKLGLMVAVAVFVPHCAFADSEMSVKNAYRICAALDKSNVLTEPCDVSGWGSSVDVKVDMSAGAARLLCGTIVDGARKNAMKFDGGWMVKIYSPYSGKSTIAYCNLS
jgi:hypothetical protein